MSVSRKSFVRAILLLLLIIVIGTMVVPYSVIEALLNKFAWLGRTFDFLDTVAPGLEVSHLLSFGMLGFLAGFAWRNKKPSTIALGIVGVAVFVEVIQIWVPGRQAAFSHAILETLGGLAGYGIAWVLTYAWGTEHLPEDYKPSTQWRGDHPED